MPNLQGSFATSLAWAKARLGHSRRDAVGRDWTPSSTTDDCALFVSSALYGTRSYFSWNVDGFKSAPHGAYHSGKAGLRVGDVVLFDWDGNGVGNHVEIVTVSPDAGGTFTTIGANGSDTVAVAYRRRNGYVLGYFRPAYATTAPASTGAKPIPASSPSKTPAKTSTPKEPEMAQSDIDDAKAALFLVTHPAKAAKYAEQIHGVYRNRLGRDADEAGLAGNLRGMALGNPITWVDLKVMASAEFKSARNQARLKALAKK